MVFFYYFLKYRNPFWHFLKNGQHKELGIWVWLVLLNDKLSRALHFYFLQELIFYPDYYNLKNIKENRWLLLQMTKAIHQYFLVIHLNLNNYYLHLIKFFYCLFEDKDRYRL